MGGIISTRSNLFKKGDLVAVAYTSGMVGIITRVINSLTVEVYWTGDAKRRPCSIGALVKVNK